MADPTTNQEIDRTADKYLSLLSPCLAGALQNPESQPGHTLDRAFTMADAVYNRLYPAAQATGTGTSTGTAAGTTGTAQADAKVDYPKPGTEAAGDDPANPAPVGHPQRGGDDHEHKPKEEGDKPAADQPAADAGDQQPTTQGAPPTAPSSASDAPAAAAPASPSFNETNPIDVSSK